jgi:hypothetical protein
MFHSRFCHLSLRLTPFLTTHRTTVALGKQGIGSLDSVVLTRGFGLAKAPDTSSGDEQNYLNQTNFLDLTLMLTPHLPIKSTTRILT